MISLLMKWGFVKQKVKIIKYHLGLIFQLHWTFQTAYVLPMIHIIFGKPLISKYSQILLYGYFACIVTFEKSQLTLNKNSLYFVTAYMVISKYLYLFIWSLYFWEYLSSWRETIPLFDKWNNLLLFTRQYMWVDLSIWFINGEGIWKGYWLPSKKAFLSPPLPLPHLSVCYWRNFTSHSHLLKNEIS